MVHRKRFTQAKKVFSASQIIEAIQHDNIFLSNYAILNNNGVLWMSRHSYTVGGLSQFWVQLAKPIKIKNDMSETYL